jgi:hypothetical protein
MDGDISVSHLLMLFISITKDEKQSIDAVEVVRYEQNGTVRPP